MGRNSQIGTLNEPRNINISNFPNQSETLERWCLFFYFYSTVHKLYQIYIYVTSKKKKKGG